MSVHPSVILSFRHSARPKKLLYFRVSVTLAWSGPYAPPEELDSTYHMFEKESTVAGYYLPFIIMSIIIIIKLHRWQLTRGLCVAVPHCTSLINALLFNRNCACTWDQQHHGQ